MRPDVLVPLFADVSSLAGVGPSLRKLLEKLCGTRLVDLLFHLPAEYIDRRFSPPIYEAPDGKVATFTVRVDEHLEPGSRLRHTTRTPYKVACSNDNGSLQLIFFASRHADALKKLLPVGQQRVVSGRVEHFDGLAQMPHPDYIVPPSEAARIQIIEPHYPLTAGLFNKQLVKWQRQALGRLPRLPEWQDAALLAREGWPAFGEALAALHFPENETGLEKQEQARARLAYDELLASQLALALVRKSVRKTAAAPLRGDGALRRAVLTELPFKLSAGQKQVLKEINDDMAQPDRMLRLLQGDVGSGKTVVALLAMLNAVECGRQAALMAPTEILARQHLAWMQPLAEKTGFRVALLTGRDKGKKREELLARLAAGEIDILLGTHALFQDDVAFRNLGLIVVDEQHRFGVEQRVMLARKGRQAHILLMTATPIPRSLTMTYFGDMDCSRLSEKPPGRQKVTTRVMSTAKMPQIVESLKAALARGEKAYWVCPLVEESEESDLAAAEARHAEFQQVFGAGKVALVHGRMKGEEKDAAMRRFLQPSTLSLRKGDRVRADATGEANIPHPTPLPEGEGAQILVATTVIEVGVNAPDATVMIVEHAERFGLSQLHQLRGRVGRGNKPAACLLLYAGKLSETARKRLGVMRDTDDGFVIAEEDLQLRGAGELLGTRQSGMPEFRFADLVKHQHLAQIARDDIKLLLHNDPELKSPRGQALRTLLYLFEYDVYTRYLRSG